MNPEVPPNKQNNQQPPKGAPNNSKQKKRWYIRWVQKWRNMTLANKFMVSFTGIIAASTIVYAVVAYCQWTALLSSNQISREAVESVQRAFISFQHFEYMRIQDPDHSNVHNWDILADFENNGATNATNVVGILQVQELPNEPTEEQFRGNYTNFPIIGIPPKSIRAMRVPTPVPEPLIFGIDLGPVITTKSPSQTHFNRHLFVWSWVYYKDVFPNTKPHVTELCNQLTGINLLTENYNPLPSQQNSRFNFTYNGCSNHNCDDEQCRDYQTIVALAEKTN